MKFYPLKVKEVRTETNDCVSVALETPEALAGDFSFHQGQYLTLKAQIDGEEVRRSYSICAAPAEGELRVAIKQVPGGKFSTYANRVLRKNDIIEAMPPMGHFYTPLERAARKNYVFFAAGSGITPVISNIKAILKAEPYSHCTLLYGNQRVASIIFKEEIEALKNTYLGRFQIFHILSRERAESDLLHGRLDEAKIAGFMEKIPHLLEGDAYFACGPAPMIDAACAVLQSKGINEDKIHVERFNAPPRAAAQTIPEQAVASRAVVKLDGLTMEVPVEKGQTILEALQGAGADAPYACKGGVCCTCRAKLTEGAVEMQANYALTAAEVRDGFILSCQAVPQTERVALDFDIK